MATEHDTWIWKEGETKMPEPEEVLTEEGVVANFFALDTHHRPVREVGDSIPVDTPSSPPLIDKEDRNM